MPIRQGPMQQSHLESIADLLMGAAHADGTLEGVEAEAVRRILRELLEAELPADLASRLESFDASSFDIQEATDKLDISESEDRRWLLNLVSTVVEADESHDLEESAYIKRVGAALGASSSEYEDLTVEIISISGKRKQPPPLPKKALAK